MQQTIVLFIQGGAGDVLCASPMVRAVRKKYPEDRIVAVSTYHALWDNNPNVDVVCSLQDPCSVYKKYCLPRKQLRFFKKHFIYDHILDTPGLESTHLLEFVCKVYGVPYDNGPPDYVISEEEAEKAKYFMSQFKKPVVLLHISGSTPSQGQPHKVHIHKDLDPKILEPIVAEHKELDFVQIGLMGEPLVTGAFDALGMPMREAINLIPHCLSFVFIESIFAHTAAALNKRGVVVFNNTDPNFFGHPMHYRVSSPNANQCELWPCNRPLGALMDIMPGYLNQKTRERPLWVCPNQICKQIPTALIERSLLDTIHPPAQTLSEARAL